MSKPKIVKEPEREEDLVVRLREHLRLAQAHQRQGQLQEAAAEHRLASVLLERITDQVTNRFDRIAKARFPTESAEMRQDLIGEMFRMLCEKLQDLSPGQRRFETHFNLCVDRLSIDAVRRIWAENDRAAKDGAEHAPAGAVLSLDAPGASPGGEDDAPSRGDRYTDPNQNVEATVLGSRMEQQLLEKLPSREYIDIFRDKLDGYTWDEIAKRRGVPESTARSRHAEARRLLKEILAQPEWKEALT